MTCIIQTELLSIDKVNISSVQFMHIINVNYQAILMNDECDFMKVRMMKLNWCERKNNKSRQLLLSKHL